jgi:hypothetical protein
VAQKPAFLAFLKSIRMSAPAAPVAGADTVRAPFQWQVPAGWEKMPPGQMQAAKFAIAGTNSVKCEVTVSIFPSDTGGTLANVNRWRNQIGLGAVTETGLDQLTSPLDPNLPDAVLADFAHKDRRLLGAIVPRNGQWFFYKMIGDPETVAAQRAAFIQFAAAQP